METNGNNLTGKQKAAIFLIALGSEKAALLLQKLSEEEVEILTDEISRWERVPSELTENVLEEFYKMNLTGEYLAQGGKEYAKQTLKRALGDHKAVEIIDRLQASSKDNLFNILKGIDPERLFELIRSEHPQTIALILSRLDVGQAASIISAFSEEIRLEIITRMVNIGEISPEVTQEIENILKKNLFSLTVEKFKGIGGVKLVADILNRMNRSTQTNIMKNLERQNPSLGEEIKKLMFVFEDIRLVEDRSLQRALREIDTKDLTLALKGANNEIKEKFFKNMSSRAIETIKEDMEYMGPVRLQDVEKAQQKIVDTIRTLEEKGEIVIRGRGGKEEEIIV